MQAIRSALKQNALQDTTKAFIENFAAAFLKEEETEMGPATAVFKYCV